SAAIRRGSLERIEPQTSHAFLRVLAVTGKAVLRKDWPDISPEIEFSFVGRNGESGQAKCGEGCGEFPSQVVPSVAPPGGHEHLLLFYRAALRAVRAGSSERARLAPQRSTRRG